MPILPDVRSLFIAADAVDRTAEIVESDAAAVERLVEGIPWRGPRRELVVGTSNAAVGSARAQAGAERDLARSLRQLAAEVERELQVLAALADRVRRHLEELLHRARALVQAASQAAVEAAQQAARVVLEVVALDTAAAVREARELAEQAYERLRSITWRLETLPPAHDPVWHQLAPHLLAWRPV